MLANVDASLTLISPWEKGAGEREATGTEMSQRRGIHLTEFANISGFWLASNLNTTAVRNGVHLNPKFIANVVAWSMICTNTRRPRILGGRIIFWWQRNSSLSLSWGWLKANLTSAESARLNLFCRLNSYIINCGKFKYLNVFNFLMLSQVITNWKFH